MDLKEILDVTLRAISSLVTLFLVTKMLGKKQVSQLSLFDYVIGISIGNFAAEMTINLESNEINGIWAVVLFGLVAYLINLMTMKSITLRRFFLGTPSILIEDGVILERNLKKNKFDINDLLEEARINGYFDVSQIECAILEANGTVSILPKREYKPVNNKDMNIKTEKEGLCSNVIIDGKLMFNNLRGIHKSEKWLKKKIKELGYSDFSKILLATVDINNKIVVFEKNKNIKSTDILE